MFLLGGVIFTIYPISISHTIDQLDVNDFIFATGKLSLCYGAGSVIGPITAMLFLDRLGPNGIFSYLVIISTFLLISTFIFIIIKKGVSKEDKIKFKKMPRASLTPSQELTNNNNKKVKKK